MENKDLDRIFKEGLSQESQFKKAEEQWAVVANKLKENKRRRGLWLPFLWIPLLGFVCTAFSAKIALDLLIQQPVQDVTYEHNALVEEKITNTGQNAPPFSPWFSLFKGSKRGWQKRRSISETFKMSNSMEKNIKASAPLHKSGFDNEQSYNTSLPLVDEQKKEESCSCPEEQAEPKPTIVEEDENEMLHTTIDVFDQIPSCDIVAIAEKEEKHIPPFLVDIKKEKRLGLNVYAGIKQDIINDPQLVDTLQNGYYLGVGWQFKKRWQLAATYSRRGVKRGTGVSPKTYHIPTDALPYETPYPTYTAVNYRNENISLTLAFNIVHQKRLRLSPLAGIQLRRTSQVQASYYFEGVYTQEIYHDRIDNESFKLSDAILGGRLEVPIYKGLSIESQYKYLISLQSERFNWQNRHRVQAGLMYHF